MKCSHPAWLLCVHILLLLVLVLAFLPFLDELRREFIGIIFQVFEDMVISICDDKLAAEHLNGPFRSKVPWFVVVWIVH